MIVNQSLSSETFIFTLKFDNANKNKYRSSYYYF